MNKRSQFIPGKGGISGASIATFLGLLFVPMLAVLRLSATFDTRIALTYLTVVSAITFFLYRLDKQRAKSGAWRISESALHFAEFAGGWPGAFLAQRIFRHKISKTRYQVDFWSIVVIHQLITFDFLQNWRYSNFAVSLFR